MLLKKLTDTCGLPGFEGEVRELIKEELKGYADKITVDRMGNLIAVKNADSGGDHIMLSAHMDEVGLCVTQIDSQGCVRFEPWGVDARVLPGKAVLVGKNKIPGVIGVKPIHLQKDNEKKNAFDLDQLYIDIGCDKKEDCEKLVSPGDFAAFDSEFTEFGETKIKAKALDDRVGCATIIEIFREMTRSSLPYSLTGVFCVQEEVGLRGSAAVSKRINADLVINIEGTIGADTEGIPENEHVTTQGAGPALSVMDRTSVYLKEYLNTAAAVAEKHGVPYQFRRSGMGGTDAGSYHMAGGGMPCIGIAVPCRYIHSPVSVMDKRDYENLVRLIGLLIREYNERNH